MLGVSKRFANYATKFVTGDGISDGFCGNRHPEPRSVRCGLP
jgi:hypothetical protein